MGDQDMEEILEIKQERRAEGSSHRGREEATMKRDRVAEELKEMRIEAKREEKVERAGERVPEEQILSRPPAVSQGLKLELEVSSPLDIALSDKQRVLLLLLYVLFRGRKVKDVATIVSKLLETTAEDVLHELEILRKLNIITLDNDIINLTPRGRRVLRTIINEIQRTLIEVPKPPSISIPHITRKPMDKEIYLAHVKTSKMDKDSDIHSKASVRIANKTTSIAPTGKEAEATEVKEAISSEEMPIPTSILTMLFESINKYGAEELLSISPDKPVIIVAVKRGGEDYIGTLLSILREIYRMKVGGLPVGRYVGTKVAKYIAEDEMMRRGLIKVIDDSRADFLKFFGINSIEDLDKIDLDKLRDRLIELSVPGLSFLVFYINEDKEKKLLGYLAKIRDKIAPAKIVRISPRELDPELKNMLAKASWGFVEPSEPLISDTIDQHFKRGEEEFNRRLEEIATKRRYCEKVRESVENEEGIEGIESSLHYQLKAFLVYYLMKRSKEMGISEEDIETEVELSVGGGKVVPDVYVKSRRIAIEVETFYGTGISPWRKLERTIEKYVRSGVVSEVWIVIPPLQTMLYLRDLVEKSRELRESGCGFIKFYTVDVSGVRLVPIEEIPRGLVRFFKPIAKA